MNEGELQIGRLDIKWESCNVAPLDINVGVRHLRAALNENYFFNPAAVVSLNFQRGVSNCVFNLLIIDACFASLNYFKILNTRKSNSHAQRITDVRLCHFGSV